MDEEQKEKKPRSKNGRGLLIGVLVLIGLLAASQLFGGGGDGSRPSTRLGTGGQRDTDTGATDAPPPPTRTPTPAATLEPRGRLVVGVDAALGELNRGNNRRKMTDVDYREDEGSISVTWAADDNISNGWSVAGIEGDAADILRAIDESGVEYETVFLAATFALQDAAGNPVESEVMLASYDRATIERIDWGSFNRAEALDIANHYQIAPALDE